MERRARFYSLDVLRGVAALAVVFWHWQHFFWFDPATGPRMILTRPLFRIFFLFYGAGWIAVDLFFTLSGFIFFWLYADAISTSRITIADFATRRLSRLYPLLVLTLVVVVAGQAVFRHMTGVNFVYPDDGYHIALHAAMASSWGLEHTPFSCNGPAWSISVEIALYAMFFAICRLVRPRLPVLLAISAAGFVILVPRYAPMGRGIGCFFLGGAVYLVYSAIARRRLDVPLAPWLLAGLAAGWMGTIVHAAVTLRLDAYPWRYGHVEDYWAADLLLFPATVLTLAVAETARGTLGKRVAWIGDVSYSSYLWHFPLQLAVAIAAVALAWRQSVFASPWMLAAFLIGVVTVSLASHRWLEMPAQRWLRTRARIADAGPPRTTPRAATAARLP